jgi:hypothetical protein
MLKLTGPLWLWNGEKGSWHFLTIPEGPAAELRLQRLAEQCGFGSIRVEVVLDDVRWRTSLFPVKGTGEYLLPVKAEVRRRANIAAGDQVTVAIDLV